MSSDLVPIATFVTAVEAGAAKLALEAEGIECQLKDDNVVGMYSIAANALGYIKLLVPASEAQRARRVLDTPFHEWPQFSQADICRQCGEELGVRDDRCRHCGAPRSVRSPPLGSDQEASFVQSLRSDRDESQRDTLNPYSAPRSEAQESEDADDEDDSGSDELAARRARCPDCSRPRVAICPFCKTMGNRFRAADEIAGRETDAEPALLICPICDEPFEPTYLRCCEWCGHEFADGIEPPAIVRTVNSEPLNWRVLLVGAAGIAIIVFLMVYFSRLLS
jgi:hypothetical protein